MTLSVKDVFQPVFTLCFLAEASGEAHYRGRYSKKLLRFGIQHCVGVYFPYERFPMDFEQTNGGAARSQ